MIPDATLFESIFQFKPSLKMKLRCQTLKRVHRISCKKSVRIMLVKYFQTKNLYLSPGMSRKCLKLSEGAPVPTEEPLINQQLDVKTNCALKSTMFKR